MVELHRIEEAAQFISRTTGARPSIGLVIDAELSGIVSRIEGAKVLDNAAIPHFIHETNGRALGKIIIGQLFGKTVIALHGRERYYEGVSLQQIAFPIRVMKSIGATHLFLIDGVGALNRQMKTGDLMVVSDHMNLLGDNPLIGHNLNALGPRFPDMSEPYSLALIRKAKDAARELKITLHEGIYAALTGPHLETNAEYKMLEKLGADAVGYSTVPEAIAANHMGMAVMAFAVITDECFSEVAKAERINEPLSVIRRAEPHLEKIIEQILRSL